MSSKNVGTKDSHFEDSIMRKTDELMSLNEIARVTNWRDVKGVRTCTYRDNRFGKTFEVKISIERSY